MPKQKTNSAPKKRFIVKNLVLLKDQNKEEDTFLLKRQQEQKEI